MGNKIQLTLIIVVTILVMTQIYTAIELIRLNSANSPVTKDCYKHKQHNSSWGQKKYGEKMTFGQKMKSQKMMFDQKMKSQKNHSSDVKK